MFVPKDQLFFDLFEEAGGNILRAADLLERMLRTYPDHGDLARDILICEQAGDRITHDIIGRLNTTDAPPIERQDIYELAGRLDDIVDFIEEAADFLGLYQVEAPMDQAQAMAGVLLEASRQIDQAVTLLRNFDDIHPYTVEVSRLEDEGDRLVRDALASLFEEGIDPIVVIRWKDIYERLEAAIDATQTVAHVLESIVIKNS
jgi:predicted phosphate transport protein (TIGR00153 family)